MSRKTQECERVAPTCRACAQQMGLLLLEIAIEREPQGAFLRLTIDKPGEAVTLADCEAYHKRVRPIVESLEYDFMEVCSPGIDRPIKTPEDFKRAEGTPVEVRLYKPYLGAKLHVGTLVGLVGGAVILNVAGADMRIEQKLVAKVAPYIDISRMDEADMGETDVDESAIDQTNQTNNQTNQANQAKIDEIPEDAPTPETNAPNAPDSGQD